ncbi:helix-turn-helix domain-containing protein [Actinokineospora xionganensis]|uniref:MerR family transcriptional regulator n=1 Tax=Actinokineospora xionganensis TaxID=2684470 RepID=A0ABR7LEZ4_9PSEU|nr:MerR family transcriptional regulator [Actinokineospora xionganensis]MBC6450949.1 MerR family transcriptional regulator [Actinokineospora xionganensis]
MGDTLLRIGELAAQAGVSTRTIDYYTHLGLLVPAERTPANYRLYDVGAVERVNTIRQLEAHGVSLDEITTALRTNNADVLGLLHRLDEDVRALREVAESTAPHAHGLLAAITTRAQSLITTALEIGQHMPPA